MNSNMLILYTQNGKLFIRKDESGVRVAPKQTELDTPRDPRMLAIQTNVIANFRREGKLPSFIIGSAGWYYNHLPHFMFEEFAIQLYYYPNNMGAYVFTAVAFSQFDDVAPVSFDYADTDLHKALLGALHGLIQYSSQIGLHEKKECSHKLIVWHRQYAIRAPKINLKEVLHMSSKYSGEFFSGELKETPVPSMLGMVYGGKD